ncbi:MAG: Nre family DNA repair protein [Thermoplasmatota archaeon]
MSTIPSSNLHTLSSQNQNKPNTNKCLLCRGTKLLCGKTRCPILIKYHARDKVKPLIDSLKIEGSSPPSIFIGRVGYPKVSIGPMIPPLMGDTSLIDTPEQWLEKSIDDIVNFRSMLVRGKFTANVHDVENPHKIITYTRELALSKNSVFTEALFQKKPKGSISFYDEIQPHGPSATLKKFDISNPTYDTHMEKAFYDTDLRSAEAVFQLYKNGVAVSKIQKAFSVGAFGVGKHRLFVPTRWSITAVDSNIGKHLLETTRFFPWLNDFRVYSHTQFDNRWVILMIPSEWQYELIEAWYPNTTWNQYSNDVAIFNSYEFYEGRTTYAEIGGCYYAGRLAVNETLHKEKRQAAVVILREAHPGYLMPIGVWNVRESVRRTLQQPYITFPTLQDSLNHISNLLSIPLARWIKTSALLKNRLYQRKLEDFLL